MDKPPNLTQELESLKTEVGKLNTLFDVLCSKIGVSVEHHEEQKPTVRMVPFDIENAKQGAKIVTKEGGNVRMDNNLIIHYDVYHYEDR